MDKNKDCKRIFTTLILLVFVALLFPFSAHAAYTYTLMEKIPGFESVSGSDFANYVLAIYKFAIWTVGIAALLMIIIGGFMYITSAGNTSRMDTAKRVIFDALYGLIVAFAAWLLLYVINPDLVKVNISLKAVTTTATSTPSKSSETTGTEGTGTEETSGSCSYSTPASGQNVCQGTACDGSCSTSAYDGYISTYAGQNGLSSAVVKSVIYHESSCNPNATSPAGACGLMQVMPQSGYSCTNDPRNLFDPETNIRLGTEILRGKYSNVQSYNYTTVTDEQMAFAAYNCCANGENPNSPSEDCNGIVPKWACPIDPGAGDDNMCDVKNYACEVDACS